MARIAIVLLSAFLLISAKLAAQLSFSQSKDTLAKKILLEPLPQNFYNQSLGYFCKKEVQLQKFTSLPLFIRLGSKEYVDYLERKPNSLKRITSE
jgi:hypothetical protein